MTAATTTAPSSDHPRTACLLPRMAGELMRLVFPRVVAAKRNGAGGAEARARPLPTLPPLARQRVVAVSVSRSMSDSKTDLKSTIALRRFSVRSSVPPEGEASVSQPCL